jgi:hypothetical protein
MFLVAVVVVTEPLTANGRGTAGEAIGLEMAAETKRHGASKSRLLAFRHRSSRKAKRELIQAVGIPSAKSNWVRAGNLCG